MLHICRMIFGKAVFNGAIEREEVAVQHDTDALQQYRVDPLALKDVIHVSTVTVEPMGQPRRAASLATQLSFNFFTDVNHHNRPSVLQQPPAATWLIFHLYENKKSSLLSVLTFNLAIRNLVVRFRIANPKSHDS